MSNGLKNNFISVNGLIDYYATSIYTQYLYINDQLVTPIINNIFTGIINQPLSLSGTNQMQQTDFNGNILQVSGTSTLLQLNCENTTISGALTQSNGNSSLNNLSVGTITQSGNNYISQNNSGTYTNNLGTTQITNLTVLDSMQFPSDVTIPGSTYNNNNIVMEGTACIQQTGTGTNTFVNSQFNNNVSFENNLSMTNINATSTFENVTIGGSTFTNNSVSYALQLNNGIYQNSGSNILLNSTFPNITFTGNINNISTTVFNYLINVTSDIQTQFTNINNNFSNYLSISTASSTYATIASLSSYLTVSNASTTYATISSLSNYLTNSTASSTYATLSFLSSNYPSFGYLSSNYATLTNLALYASITYTNSTFATIETVNGIIANFTNYLTVTNAASTYATITSLSNYLQNVTIGTVTTNTLSTSETASVTVTSTLSSNDAILNFTFNIPFDSEDATNAQNSANEAQSYANQAQSYSNSASGYASNASNSASSASNSASSASNDASNASNDASNASSSAGLAAGSATAAGLSAGAAGLSAGLAAGSATAAGLSATAAAASAEAAAASATSLEDQLLYQTTGTNGNGNYTRFNSQILANNGITDEIVLNPYGQSIFYKDLQVNTLEAQGNTSVGGTFYVSETSSLIGAVSAPSLDGIGTSPTLNVGTSSYIVNVGSTTAFTTVNLNGLDINITGILSINGVPYIPYPTGFSFQSGYFIQT